MSAELVNNSDCPQFCSFLKDSPSGMPKCIVARSLDYEAPLIEGSPLNSLAERSFNFSIRGECVHPEVVVETINRIYSKSPRGLPSRLKRNIDKWVGKNIKEP